MTPNQYLWSQARDQLVAAVTSLECVSKCREMQFRAERLKTQRVFRSGP